MKLGAHRYARSWDLHAWVGVIASLALYVMFHAGAFVLFYPELRVWQSDRVAPAADAGRLASLDRMVRGLTEAVHPDRPSSVEITFAPRQTLTRVVALDGEGREREWELLLDPRTGRVDGESRGSRVAELLYELHYLHVPGVRLLDLVAGGACLLLLLALVTGLVLHLPRLVRHRHRLRLDVGERFGWSDLHTVLGVAGLPFQLLFALSGALLMVGSEIAAPFDALALRSRTSADALAGWTSVDPGPSSRPRLDLDALLVRVEAVAPGFEPRRIRLRDVGTDRLVLDTRGVSTAHPPRPLAYDGSNVRVEVAGDGRILTAALGPGGPTEQALRWLFGLHMAKLRGEATRWLYALLAVATAVVLVSGNGVWIARRDPHRAQPSTRALERLTWGATLGLSMGIAGAFALHPMTPGCPSPLRGQIQVGGLLALWALGFAWVRRPGAALWLAGALYAFAGLATLGEGRGAEDVRGAVSVALVVLGAAHLALIPLARVASARSVDGGRVGSPGTRVVDLTVVGVALAAGSAAGSLAERAGFGLLAAMSVGCSAPLVLAGWKRRRSARARVDDCVSPLGVPSEPDPSPHRSPPAPAASDRSAGGVGRRPPGV